MAQTRLKQLREEAVLTVHELAKASGVSDDTISKIENGQRVARPSTLRKLAGALEVSPQELKRLAKTEEPVLAGKAEAPPPGPESEYNKEDRLELLRRMEIAILAIVQRSRLDLETIDIGATDRKATADQLISIAAQSFWSYRGAKQHVDADEIVQAAIEGNQEERRAARRIYAALTELFKAFDDINLVVDAFAAPAGASAGREGATITYIEEHLRERAS